MGATLDEDWSSPAKLLDLLGAGDIVQLASDLGSCEREAQPPDAVISVDRAAFRTVIKESGAGYAYLFTALGWLGMRCGFDYQHDGERQRRADSDWMPVTTLLALERGSG